MKKIILFVCSIFIMQSVYAQKETYNWVFGQATGLTWNSLRDVNATGLGGGVTVGSSTTLKSLPVELISSISTQEGCFTLSNSTGTMQFYSDGMNIWKNDNSLMTNGTGLNGDKSSAQSGIIFPYPISTTKYVAVSVGLNLADNVSYNIIDNNVVTSKNIRLNGASGSTGETVTSIRHADNSSYWIIALGRGTNSYLNAWKFTSTGLVATPVVSLIGNYTLGNGACGYLKITPDGKHFVMTTFLDKKIVYGDFDNSTGIFSNIKVVTALQNSPYGVEFSRDQSLVYISSNTGIMVYKADELFSKPNINDVTQKIYSLVNDGIGSPGALQIGPDERIYWANYNTRGLRIIDNPNDFDNPMIYSVSNLFIANNFSFQGLPSFAANWFQGNSEVKRTVCSGYDSKFTVTVSDLEGKLATSLKWDFGDGTIIDQPITTGKTSYDMNHTYTVQGTYRVTITPVKSNGSALTSRKVSASTLDCEIKTNRMIRVDLQNGQ